MADEGGQIPKTVTPCKALTAKSDDGAPGRSLMCACPANHSPENLMAELTGASTMGNRPARPPQNLMAMAAFLVQGTIPHSFYTKKIGGTLCGRLESTPLKI